MVASGGSDGKFRELLMTIALTSESFLLLTHGILTSSSAMSKCVQYGTHPEIRADLFHKYASDKFFTFEVEIFRTDAAG